MSQDGREKLLIYLTNVSSPTTEAVLWSIKTLGVSCLKINLFVFLTVDGQKNKTIVEPALNEAEGVGTAPTNNLLCRGFSG